MLQSYFALIPGFCKMRNPLDEQPATNYSSHKKHLGFGKQPSIIQAEWSREVLVLVSLVHRCCYCSRGALLLFLPGWSRQDRIIQHFTVACHPCHFGSCNGRQHLVALVGQRALAIVLVVLLAIPGTLYALFILLLVILHPNFR